LACAGADAIAAGDPRHGDPAAWAAAIAERARRGEDLLVDSYAKHLIALDDSAASHHVSDALALVPRLLEEGDDTLAHASIVRQANRCQPHQAIRDPGQGFAPAALTAALYYALGRPSLADALPAALALGRDAHDVGAIVGAVVGARDGAETIPPHWISQLHNAQQIRSRADHLAAGAIDFSGWRGIVDLETAATAGEQRERRRLAARWEKQGILARKPRRPRPAREPETPFAPPPEVWLSSKRPDRQRRREEKIKRKERSKDRRRSR
jgi:hypothetical protein